MMQLKPVAKGLATMVPGLCRLVARGGGGGTASPDYCYTVWMKHFSFLWDSGMRTFPLSIAELGPGSSLGVGLAWLLAGAQRFYALDVAAHSNTEANLCVLDGLVDRFRRRAPDPIGGWPDFHKLLGPGLFPAHALGDDQLAKTLAPARIKAIREAIRNPQAQGDFTVRYMVPWSDPSVLPASSMDLIYSHSVLEHVTDAPAIYASCARWLKLDGWMSHQIDLQSHGVTPAWNGHWQYPGWLWRIILGGRPYLINRHNAAAHMRMIRDAGFQLPLELREVRTDGMPRAELAAPWRDMSDEEVACSSLFVQARRP